MDRFSRRIIWLTCDNRCLLGKQEILKCLENHVLFLERRGISRSTATSKMKLFVTLVNGFQSLTNATKNSILAAARVLDLLPGSL